MPGKGYDTEHSKKRPAAPKPTPAPNKGSVEQYFQGKPTPFSLDDFGKKAQPTNDRTKPGVSRRG
jgi:hypothetical protein